MIKIEICCTSIDTALMAQKYGANRIELCSELFLGGITPSIGLIVSCIKELKIPIRVLLRPRGGNFNYSDNEIKVIINDIIRLKDLGVEGLVLGLANEKGSIPISKLERILNIVDGKMKLTFHKAFDYLKKPIQELKMLTDLGFDTILTSGRKKTAYEGITYINKLRKAAKDKILIMPGGSINSENFNSFKVYKYKWIHLSAKKQLNFDNKMQIEIPFEHQPTFNIDIDNLKKINRQNKV